MPTTSAGLLAVAPAAAAAASIHFGFWLGLILIVPAAGFLLRLFMLQHDCGHGSFFGRRRLDDWPI